MKVPLVQRAELIAMNAVIRVMTITRRSGIINWILQKTYPTHSRDGNTSVTQAIKNLQKIPKFIRWNFFRANFRSEWLLWTAVIVASSLAGLLSGYLAYFFLHR